MGSIQTFTAVSILPSSSNARNDLIAHSIFSSRPVIVQFCFPLIDGDLLFVFIYTLNVCVIRFIFLPDLPINRPILLSSNKTFLVI